MDRQAYNQCIKEKMQGKQFTGPERKKEFCISAKLCSQKSATRDEAAQVCSLPKEPKEPKVHRAAHKGGKKKIRVVLLTNSMCLPCESVKRDLSTEIKDGLIEVIDVLKPAGQAIAQKVGITTVPTMVLLDAKGQTIAKVAITGLGG